MTLELDVLAGSVVLGIVQILLQAHSASLQRGYRWAASPRDEPVAPLTGVAGRLERALRNFLETFPLFAVAVLIAHLQGRQGWMTRWGALMYLGGRIAFVPLLVLGVPLLRSVIWNVATIGIFLVLLALVWPP
jgi:uncharacterized MAPEG superfamily protein